MRWRHEDGSVAVITAICLVVLIGSAALAIDLGAVRTDRRIVVTTTDAVALGVAKYLSDYGADPGPVPCDLDGAYGLALELIDADNPESSPPSTLRVEVNGVDYVDLTVAAARTAMSLFPCPESGHVVAGLDTATPLTFGQIFGRASTDVTAETTVVWGTALSTILPLGFCANQEPIPTAVAHLTDDEPYPSDEQYSVPLHFPIGGSGADENGCGVTPGNLGFINCNGDAITGGGGGGSNLPGWIESGCDIEFEVANPGDLNPAEYEVAGVPIADDLDGTTRDLTHASGQGNRCGTSPEFYGWCDVVTGSVSSVKSALRSLSGEQRTIVIYDYADCGNPSAGEDYAPCSATTSSAVEYRLREYVTLTIDAVCFESPGVDKPAECTDTYQADPGDPGQSGDPDWTGFDVDNASGFVLWVRFEAFSSLLTEVDDGGNAAGRTRTLAMCGTERVSC